jgi:molecular chaperone Hsp33
LHDSCRCSDERIEDMLRGFSQQERDDMIGEDGMIGVTCEFCSTLRRYHPRDFEPG